MTWQQYLVAHRTTSISKWPTSQSFEVALPFHHVQVSGLMLEYNVLVFYKHVITRVLCFLYLICFFFGPAYLLAKISLSLLLNTHTHTHAFFTVLG